MTALEKNNSSVLRIPLIYLSKTTISGYHVCSARPWGGFHVWQLEFTTFGPDDFVRDIKIEQNIITDMFDLKDQRRINCLPLAGSVVRYSRIACIKLGPVLIKITGTLNCAFSWGQQYTSLWTPGGMLSSFKCSCFTGVNNERMPATWEIFINIYTAPWQLFTISQCHTLTGMLPGDKTLWRQQCQFYNNLKQPVHHVINEHITGMCK